MKKNQKQVYRTYFYKDSKLTYFQRWTNLRNTERRATTTIKIMEKIFETTKRTAKTEKRSVPVAKKDKTPEIYIEVLATTENKSGKIADK